MNNIYESLIGICEKIIDGIRGIMAADNAASRHELLIRALNAGEYLVIKMRETIRERPLTDVHRVIDQVSIDVAHETGYGIDYTSEGWPRFILPPLLTQRMYRKHGNLEQIRGFVRAIIRRHFSPDNLPPLYKNQVVIFKHIDSCLRRDHDNTEKKVVLDEIGAFYLVDDNMEVIDVFECSRFSEEESFLSMYIVPRDQFVEWLEKYKDRPEMKLKH